MLNYLLQADIVDAVQAAPVQQEMSFSLIDMAVKGGWLMIVLLALSLVAIYLEDFLSWVETQGQRSQMLRCNASHP